MSHPQTSEIIPLELPILGLNRRDALSRMSPLYSPHMMNWEPEAQFCRVRNGYVNHHEIDADDTILAMGTYDNGDTMFAYVDDNAGNHKIYEITTGGSSTLVETTAGSTSTQCWVARFNNRLAFVTNDEWANESRVWDGTSWSSWGFSEDVDNKVGGPVVCSHKGRVYIFTSTTAWYSALGAVTGICTEYDFRELFDTTGQIYWANTLSSPGNRADEQYFVFGNAGGEVLVFAGDYPDASNWQLVGRYQISKPLDFNSIFEFKNDIWVFTETGIVSIRELMIRGSEIHEKVSVSPNIDPYWTDIVRLTKNAGDTPNASAAFFPEENKVYVLLDGHASIAENPVYFDSFSTMFVYNVFSGGWAPHKIIADDPETVGSCSYFNNSIYYYVTNSKIMKRTTGFIDEDPGTPSTDVGYDCELRGAYTNFGTPNKNRHVRGFEANVKRGTSITQLKMKADADFGRQTSDTGQADLNAIGTRETPYVAVGVTGNYLQYQITVTTTTTASSFEVYSIGANVG